MGSNKGLEIMSMSRSRAGDEFSPLNNNWKSVDILCIACCKKRIDGLETTRSYNSRGNIGVYLFSWEFYDFDNYSLIVLLHLTVPQLLHLLSKKSGFLVHHLRTAPSKINQ